MMVKSVFVPGFRARALVVQLDWQDGYSTNPMLLIQLILLLIQLIQSIAKADKRLHESSDNSRGCGGIGILWNKRLQAFPIDGIECDRICGVRFCLGGY